MQHGSCCRASASRHHPRAHGRRPSRANPKDTRERSLHNRCSDPDRLRSVGHRAHLKRIGTRGRVRRWDKSRRTGNTPHNSRDHCPRSIAAIEVRSHIPERGVQYHQRHRNLRWRIDAPESLISELSTSGSLTSGSSTSGSSKRRRATTPGRSEESRRHGAGIDSRRRLERAFA